MLFELRRRLRADRKLLTFCDANNFGDEMSYYLYPFIGRNYSTKKVMLIGSLLQEYNQELVLGSGFISMDNKDLDSLAEVSFVRGKLSASKIRSGCDYVCDPGLLANEIFNVVDRQMSEGIVAFIPHVSEVKNLLAGHIKVPSNVRIILPTDHPRQVLRKMAECSTIYSSSLHGLIFAHSLGIVAEHVKVSSMVIGGSFKFRDYYSVFKTINYSSVAFEDCDWKCLDGLTKIQKEEIASIKIRLKEYLGI